MKKEDLIWFEKNQNGEFEFKALTEDQIKDLSNEDKSLYYKHNMEAMSVTIKSIQEELKKKDSDSDKLESFKQELDGYRSVVETLKEGYLNQGEIISEIKKNKNRSKETVTFDDILKEAWDENEDSFKKALNKEISGLNMTINKAQQTYGDIDSGLDLAPVRPGIIDAPVRAPRVKSLFTVTPISSEFVKYVEQNTVVRDAQNVAKCAPVTSLTKETLIVRNIESKVIKDTIEFCRTFISDYPFMRARIEKLLLESVQLREDDQLLLGNGTGEQTFSIDFHASEFSAANPVCDVSTEIQDATMVDLILAMRTQISVLGEQNSFMPDTVLVNLCDWFLKVESRKDADGNYIDSRVQNVNGQPFIGGMRVIPLQNVAQNTLYVFDSTKGEVLDRMTIELDVAFQNKDNWEKEIADLKAMTRINFWVPNQWKNAFMKTTDVDAAILAINKT